MLYLSKAEKYEIILELSWQFSRNPIAVARGICERLIVTIVENFNNNNRTYIKKKFLSSDFDIERGDLHHPNTFLWLYVIESKTAFLECSCYTHSNDVYNYNE